MAAPTNKERLDRHDARLTEIETALGLKPPTPRKSFIAEKYEWVINHRATSIFLAIILCVVSIFGKYWLDHKNESWNRDVDDRVALALNAKGGIKETLGAVQQTVLSTDATLKALTPFIHDVINHQFENASKLLIATLQERLPAIQHLLATAQNQGVKVDTKVLDALTRKLSATNASAVGFWPAAAGLISYRSRVAANDFGNPVNLPNCTDSDPFPLKVTEVGPKGEIKKIANAFYENCRFTFDSATDDARINSILLNKAPTVEFRHCLIVYRGGDFTLVTHLSVNNAPIQGGSGHGAAIDYNGPTLQFVQCFFDFSVSDQIPKNGQEATHALLAQTKSPLVLFLSPHV
jgi:hypothetical protein